MAASVFAALSDISVRYRLEDCVAIPAHSEQKLYVDMSDKIMNAYKQMEKDSVLIAAEGPVNAVNAAVRTNKLLQILSGAVYAEDGSRTMVDGSRYDLVMELVGERPHSVVAFNWDHEKEGLLAKAKSMGLPVAVIDGKTPVNARTKNIADFQEGKLRALLCHPQAASHGITLTRGTTTIWASPTYSSELFLQFNRRIYRAGQTQKTQTIMVCARHSKEERVYDVLNGKVEGINQLLDLFTGGWNEREGS